MGVFASRSHRVIETSECKDSKYKRLQEIANGIF